MSDGGSAPRAPLVAGRAFGFGADIPGLPASRDHPGYGAPRYEPGRYEPPGADRRPTRDPRSPVRPAGPAGNGGPRALDRQSEETHPVVKTKW